MWFCGRVLTFATRALVCITNLVNCTYMCVLSTQPANTDVLAVCIKWQLWWQVLHLNQDSLFVSCDVTPLCWPVFACTHVYVFTLSCELNTDVLAGIKWQLWWRVLHLYQDPSPLARGTPSLCQYIHLVLLSGATALCTMLHNEI